MMRKNMSGIVSTLALLLGVAHIGYGALAYKNLTLDSFWFCSFGLGMIVTALANFAPRQSYVLIIQNALTVIFMSVLLYLVQQPQIILGVILFSLLLIMSCMRKPSIKLE